MKNEQFLQLLNLNIIDIKEEEELKELLNLYPNQIEFILNSRIDKKIAYMLIKNIKNKEIVESIVNMASEITNEKSRNEFYFIACNEDLLNSPNYRSIIEKTSKIKDPHIMFLFRWIACKPNLINHKSYTFVLDLCTSIENKSLMVAFADLVCHEVLLKSKFHMDLAKFAAKIKNPDLFPKLITTCVNSYIDTKDDYLSTIVKLDPCLEERIMVGILDIINILSITRIRLTPKQFEKIIQTILSYDKDIAIQLLDEVNIYVLEKSKKFKFLNSILPMPIYNISASKILKIIEESTKELNLVTVISQNPDNLEEILGQYEDDEDITPNTIIKTLNFKNNNTK